MDAPLSSQQLRSFVVLGRHLHMGLAAAELGVTASALSHSLKALESELGCQLMDRGPKSMRLTQPGRELLAVAGQVMEKLEYLRSRFKERPEWKQPSLRIAAGASACQYLLPPVLREFVESFKGMHIAMDPCSTTEAAQRVLRGDVDCAVCPEPEDLSGLVSFPIGEDELRFMVPSAHPWTHRGKATRIEEQSLITPDRHSDARSLISAHFRTEGIALTPLIEAGSDDAIKQFIRLGLGVGILPEWAARSELDSGLLCSVPLGRRRLRRTWCVLHSKQRRSSMAEDLFANLCRTVARDLMSPAPAKKRALARGKVRAKLAAKRRKKSS